MTAPMAQKEPEGVKVKVSHPDGEPRLAMRGFAPALSAETYWLFEVARMA